MKKTMLLIILIIMTGQITAKGLYNDEQPDLLFKVGYADIGYPNVWSIGLSNILFKIPKVPVYLGTELVSGYPDGPLTKVSFVPIVLKIIAFDNFSFSYPYIPIYITSKINPYLNYFVREDDTKFLKAGKDISIGFGTEVWEAPKYIAESITLGIEAGYFYQDYSTNWKWINDEPLKGFYLYLNIAFCPTDMI